MTDFLGNFQREVLTPNPLSAPHPLHRVVLVVLTVSVLPTNGLPRGMNGKQHGAGGQLESHVLPPLLWSPASSLGPRQVHAPCPFSSAPWAGLSACFLSVALSKPFVFLGGFTMIVRQYRGLLSPFKTFLLK